MNELLYKGWYESINYNRWDIIAKLVNTYKLESGVEIGLGWGENFKNVAQLCPTFQWTGIDPYTTTQEKFTLYKPDPNGRNELRTFNFAKWKPDLESFCRSRNSATVIWERDLDAVKWFQDESLDLIYIDIDCSYHSIIRNIDAWKSKLSSRGFFCGCRISEHPERAEDILAAVNSRFTRFAQFGTDFWAAKKKNLKDEIIERTDLMEMIYDN